MTLGEKITAARKRKGLSQKQLGERVGLSKSAIWTIESDTLKGGVDAATMVKIVDALEEESLLMAYLENNQVYHAVIPRVFPDLNNIRRDPAIIFTRLAKEADEARESALILAEVFSNAEPRNVPQFDEVFKSKMEQILDIKRGAEILEFQLLAAGVLTQEGLREIYALQQRKCENKGHHIPEERRAGEDRRQEPGGCPHGCDARRLERRTGTEG